MEIVEHMTDERYGELVEKLQEKLGPEYTVEAAVVEKVNGNKDAITIKKHGENVAPTLYPDNFMSQDQAAGVDELADVIFSKIQEVYDNMPEFNLNLTHESAEEHLYPQVISAEANEEMLQHVPHRMITDDLAVIARYRVGEDGSFVVKDGHLDAMEMTDEEVLETAISNLDVRKYDAKDIKDVMSEMMGADSEMMGLFPPTRPEFYVLTNEEKINGAAALASDEILQQSMSTIYRDYPNSHGFYVIPSSLHEVLLIPEEKVMTKEDEENLENMLREVNQTQVAPEDVLSNNVYHYDGLTHDLTVVDPNAETKVDEEELEMSMGRSH